MSARNGFELYSNKNKLGFGGRWPLFSRNGHGIFWNIYVAAVKKPYHVERLLLSLAFHYEEYSGQYHHPGYPLMSVWRESSSWKVTNSIMLMVLKGTSMWSATESLRSLFQLCCTTLSTMTVTLCKVIFAFSLLLVQYCNAQVGMRKIVKKLLIISSQYYLELCTAVVQWDHLV